VRANQPVLDVSALLRAWTDGDQRALAQLTPIVYDELHRLARRYLRGERKDHSLQTTALVNEAYLRLVDHTRMAWQNRAHFFAVSAQVMRRILVDHARRRNIKRGRGMRHVSLDEATIIGGERPTDLAALVERVRSTGLQVTVTGSPGPVPEPVDAAAYVVVQESLTNVLKHAGATSTSVGLSRAGGRLAVAVLDDGGGGEMQAEGMGLSGMRQRVEALGGSLTAGPRAAGGFEVRAELPL